MQDSLFGEQAPKLTEFQTLVLELVWREVGAGAAGISSVEAGIAVHEAKGCRYCDFVQLAPCLYAKRQGRQVLESLRKKGLVSRRMPMQDGRRQEVWGLSERDARSARESAARLTSPPARATGSHSGARSLSESPAGGDKPSADDLYNTFPEGF